MNETQNFTTWRWAIEEATFSAKAYGIKFAIVDNQPYYGVMPLKLVTNQLILEIVNGGEAEALRREDTEVGDEGAEEGGLGEGTSPSA